MVQKSVVKVSRREVQNVRKYTGLTLDKLNKIIFCLEALSFAIIRAKSYASDSLAGPNITLFRKS